MPILTYETQLDGLLVHSDRGWLMLTIYSSQAIRVRYTERSEFRDKPSLMIVAQPDEDVCFEVRETEGSLLFSTDDLTIEIDRPRLGIMVYGLKDGRLPIERVAEGSAAETAGLRAGDEIVRLNGRAVAEIGASELGVAMMARPLVIALLRDGATVDVTIDATRAAPSEAKIPLTP
jgi:predicted metalloprotease with PDZ domain